MKNRKLMATAAASLSLLISLSACSPAEPEAKPSASPSTSATQTAPAPQDEAPHDDHGGHDDHEGHDHGIIASEGKALAALEDLPVKNMTHTDDYERSAFGKAWDDVDNNGCDTRNDILARDLTEIVVDSSCKVQTGVFNDPYTGTVINFDRSTGNGGGVDIDHIIPLSLAWQTGAADWDEATRVAFANDPLNLAASDAGENRKKGDKDASRYLPPNVDFQCEYVARQITVRTKYAAFVTPAEKDAMKAVLNTCPDQLLSTDGKPGTDENYSATPAAPVAPAAAKPAPAPAEAVPAAPAGGGDPQFPSCAKAKAAGYGPYTSDRPEYSWYRDGDGDGTVCE